MHQFTEKLVNTKLAYFEAHVFSVGLKSIITNTIKNGDLF